MSADTVSRSRKVEVKRCEATTTERWYSKSHRCPYAAVVCLDGDWLCKLHASKWAEFEGLPPEATPWPTAPYTPPAWQSKPLADGRAVEKISKEDV